MQTVRFLQLSDLHLDSSLTAGRLGLPPDKVRIRQGEIRGILPLACDLARERRADIVLIPGDLLDDEAISMDTVNFVIETLAGLAPVPVVIAPGNHDFYSLGSPYNVDLLAARRQKGWPANVKIFRDASWEIWPVPGLEGVSVTGMAHAAGASIEERLIGRRIPRDEEATVTLLLFHGSRDNTELPRRKLLTLPFSDAELADQGFDYAAVGHYHEVATIANPSGRIIGAYAGCPAGRGLDEQGEKSVIVGAIAKEEGADGPVRLSLEHVPLDRRRIQIVEVHCTGLTHKEAILNRADEQLALREPRTEDIVYLRFVGRVSPGIDLRLPDGYLADRYFHVATDLSRLRPAYDLERYRREELRTTEARFAREMLRRLEETSNPSERRLMENALYYGLDALVQKEVSPRYEE